MKKKSIDRACYVSILPDLYINEPSDGLILIDKISKIHYELATDTPCDRSDLTCLNIDYQNSNLNILMEIKENLSFTHIVRDSHGFIFAVEIVDL
ncbi:hypothetical protein [Clostridium botulinum]|uniref:hypothetical protein n=1 Tax=Clostridium botulinum TaxID=1491 RepID=UPI000586425D|nr:hypothetical protein [Clostridium botulinum]AJE13455.1 hypothetical protein T259_4183 [Clostridium botulinum CDC_1436]